MKNLIFLLLFGPLLSMRPVYSQNNRICSDDVVIKKLPTHLKVGDRYYSSKYRGIKNLMTDYYTAYPDLYVILLPEFEHLRRKRNWGYTTLISSNIVGTTLIVSSFTFLKENAGSMSTENLSIDKPNTAVALTGIGICIVGTLVAGIILPERDDIYRFINLHNQKNEEEKMEWQIGTNFTPDNFQLSLTMKF